MAGLLIRLRAELLALALGFALLAAAYSWLPPAAASAVVAVTVAVLLAVPALRRFVSRRASAVMTRHRLRQVLVERRCLNFSRHAPLFLWSHPTEVGETVWLLLRAGISPSDVEDQIEWIASGCFARDARVTPTRRMTALVRVDVIRRDPLARDLIASELDDWTATTGQAPPRGTVIVPPKPANQHHSGTRTGATNGVPVSRSTLDERDDVPVVIDHPEPAQPEHSDRAENERAVVPDRGGDWSDYV
ncbi:hypothetical protein [Actinomycetospora straminea]|uniref:hypothetical protein n=1 Tax=Actinomycetospora straminea TaxID=663607 RepID=UPI00236615DD|nr:hypothetical protein [Actinomycetospora straminea]MDD7935482.1 hypothetical protein [Actinomycetospora straminea]